MTTAPRIPHDPFLDPPEERDLRGCLGVFAACILTFVLFAVVIFAVAAVSRYGG